MTGTARGPTATAREAQTSRGASLVARLGSFVRLPHTLFALPFAGIGVVLASWEAPSRITVSAVAWVVLAFTAARFAAMGFNRIVDRHIDAANPRTRQRELPAGRLSLAQAITAVAAASAVFAAAAWQLNPLCGRLAPLALAWVFFYSYTKRFTSWSHHVLGLSLGIAPVGGYLGVTGAWSEPWYALIVLAAAVTFWVAGFDVIYALQDEAFDRGSGLHSLAARHGPSTALVLARAFHVVAVLLFLAIRGFRLFPVGWLFTAGVGIMAMLLFYENRVARSAVGAQLDLRRIDRAFFRVNVAVSLILFALTLADRVAGGPATGAGA
ncbi:MAG: putative 4-hydroxybenzoate polyprenyltransferase [Gemmatimonadetes bacterium]|nr:putative 4-hydroxybenzoate polyprenyltransferase [Gemmatimonadota bacterium]